MTKFIATINLDGRSAILAMATIMIGMMPIHDDDEDEDLFVFLCEFYLVRKKTTFWGLKKGQKWPFRPSL